MKKLYFLLFILSGCIPIQQSSDFHSENGKTLQLLDLSYEPQIKTVRLSPLGVDSRAQLLPAVVQLGTWNLLLQFDDLRPQRENYYARIIGLYVRIQ